MGEVKMNKEDFLKGVFLIEVEEDLDAVDCWESGANEMIWAFKNSLCPLPSDDIQEHISFNYETEFKSLVESVVQILKLRYDNDEQEMIADLTE